MENLVNNSENSQPDTDTGLENAAQPAPGAVLTGDSDPKMEDFMSMYEESLKHFEEGEVVTGTIISVDRDHVLVDVGYKSEGQIPIHEFKDENGKIDVKLNDRVEVMIEVWDEEEERVILSKEKAAKVKVWEAIKDIHEADGTIEGVITNRVKGGFSVDVGVQAFLPGSQADLRPIRNLDEMVGKTLDFKILKFNRKRNNIVLSRRAILESERESKRSATLASIEEGSVMEGVVKNITEYGIFVDLGGVDGLLHITDISWGRVKHPSELYSVGDTIKVKVLSFDRENERVSLGMKQLVPDPWTTAQEKYPVGTRVHGRVVSLTDYGAFVEVEEGIEGLIHVSEMSWTRKVRHPSKVVSAGEVVEAIVLDIRPENRRISLGMKQITPNPWDMISEKYPIGSTIEGKIKNITDFGIFIGIDDDIDGLVHISDISWIKRIKHPSELYKKGNIIQARVLDIDKSNERFSLGIKQLEDDPWKTVAERYPAGTEINGTITNITDFGIFVELEEGIEGLVHVSEISKEKIKTPVGRYEVGATLTAKVMSINTEDRRIGLSVKRLGDDDDQAILEEYVTKSNPAPSSFGAILKENLQEKLNGRAKTAEKEAADTVDAVD
ncbi:MAG: 30S ribosomal protein S1, partial [Desulfobacterales bacterium CG23_combo_of_CG06-09_8_20_14_all_51_8]